MSAADKPPTAPALVDTPPLAKRTVPIPASALTRVPVTPGAAVLFTHYPDGLVTATCRGLVGFGGNEDEALTDLGEKLLMQT